MTWNWEQPDWPRFTWKQARMDRAEESFLIGAGALAGAVAHMDEAERADLAVEALSVEALTTSEIEGEILDRTSVQSSVRRHLGLATDSRRARPAERGVAEMMVDLYRTFAEPLSKKRLCSWHAELLAGRTDLRDVGVYRTGGDPMQVVSGPIHAPRVHFEAPPASRVEEETAQFIEWFNHTGPAGAGRLPALTRAGVAHLYFESIHPFEDGNGRIGRAIAEKALAQALDRPTLTVLAATILVRRRSYYDALEAANKRNEVTDWHAWFAATAMEAQGRTKAHVEFLIDKTKLLDRLRGRLSERQEKALLRMLREGPEGFRGGMSAGNYATITGASPATATRDLASLVEMGALHRTGQRRHARYHLAIPLRPVEAVVVASDGTLRSR